ncbi:MAG TPA: outer membrane beta-barrel protein [Acidobacteriaceae bacterium]|nr:outer membrane beta-barrel protein [Acidobacteriaceae bacterium]
MPQSFVSIRRCFALFVAIALSLSVHAAAQSAQAFSSSLHTPVQGGVKARSVDASVDAGVNNVGIIQDKAHDEFGFSGGYSFIKQLTLSGEFSYLPLSAGNANLDIGLYGVNLRYFPLAHPFDTTRIVPYMIVGEGYAHYGSTGGSLNGSYFGLGAGTSFYITDNFGIRPEYRWEDLQYNASYQNFYSNASHFTIAAFYQWGGRE